MPKQTSLFEIPEEKIDLIHALQSPLSDIGIPMPSWPKGAKSAHPFDGGESSGKERVEHLLKSGKCKGNISKSLFCANGLRTIGAFSRYKDTRNEMLGTDFSTKLSAWFAHGFLSPVYVNARMVAFEDGTDPSLSQGQGYGKGENKGTGSARFEFLWRDYMRTKSPIIPPVHSS